MTNAEKIAADQADRARLAATIGPAFAAADALVLLLRAGRLAELPGAAALADAYDKAMKSADTSRSAKDASGSPPAAPAVNVRAA